MDEREDGRTILVNDITVTKRIHGGGLIAMRGDSPSRAVYTVGVLLILWVLMLVGLSFEIIGVLL